MSVVIPAYNEAVMLPSCLESLKEQDYDGRYEIIVVDNNSSDLTPKIAKIYGARVIKEKRQGVVFARQTGFMAARGEIVASTDADTIVPPYWINEIVRQFKEDPRLVGLSGRLDLVGTNSLVKIMSKSLLPLGFLLDKLLAYPGSFAGANLAVKKGAFLQIGGFNTDLPHTEDIDLGKRLKKIGKTKVLSALKVKTSARRLTGFAYTLRYSVLNYIVFYFSSKTLSGFFKVVRQKAYEAYDNASTNFFFLPIIAACLIIIVILAGNLPFINLWSVSSVKTQDKVVALTFDDGPSDATPAVLDLLEKEGVKATFFVVGENTQRYPEIVSREFKDGNLIGLHSYSHSRTAMVGPVSLFKKDVDKNQRAIEAAVGQKPRFYRPPFGFRTVWNDESLRKSGFVIVTWNDITSDWKIKDSKKIAINLIRKAKPGGILVLHDGDENKPHANRAATIKAAEEVIGLLKAEGYQFVTLDKLLGKPGYF